jgi:hypothetical protein
MAGFIHQMMLQQCKDQIEAKIGCPLPTRGFRGRPACVLYVKGTDPLAAPKVQFDVVCRPATTAPAASTIRYHRAVAAAPVVGF